MIQVSNLTYEYPSTRALDNISFNIEKGSITALVGPNGAGKTTLLKCLSALSKPFSGSVFINGIDVIEHPKECHKTIGYLQDFIGLYSNLTVKQSLTYFALAYHVPSSELQKRVADVIYKLNLSDKTNERISALSRGMRQRLAIGHAIIHNPPVLLLDEPASGLDPEARHALSQLFLELNRQGMTILVSSHILSELDEYATNLIILRNGKITDANSFQEDSKNLVLTVLEVSDKLIEILNAQTKIDQVIINERQIHFTYKGNEEEQYELIKKLVESNIPLVECYARKANIQDQYLEFVKKQ